MTIATNDIAALAFDLAEIRGFSSLDDDTDEARSAKREYPRALQVCLEAYEWSFARRRQEMIQVRTAHPLSPNSDLGYPFLRHTYDLPADFCRMLTIEPAGTCYQIDGRQLRADHGDHIYLSYISSNIDEVTMPQTFQTAVAYQLAAFLAPAFVSSRTKRADLENNATHYLTKAMQNDAHTASARNYDGSYVSNDWVRSALR